MAESNKLRGNAKDPKLGILLLQIDGTSFASLHRTMPSVVDHFTRVGGWFPLKGHHKTALNTVPNTKHILTGYKAEPRDVFKIFKNDKYITAYVEDVSSETFHYFADRADFESLPMKKVLGSLPDQKSHIVYTKCNGNYSVFDRVYDQLLDFATTFQGERHFGLFVSSAFSHDDVSGLSMVEESMLRYMQEIDRLGVRNNSIVFFYGDHGLRYGEHRVFFEGAREDSMPMLWISLPEWFQRRHPDIVEALNINRHRLSSHFDFHETLRHVIQLDGGSGHLLISRRECRTCQSLFRVLPEDRQCSDAKIPLRWCFCNAHTATDPWVLRKEKRYAMNWLVQEMNRNIEYNHKACKRLTRPQLLESRMAENMLIVTFKTNLPGRVFEVGAVIRNDTERGERVEPDLETEQQLLAFYKISYCGPLITLDYCDCEKRTTGNDTQLKKQGKRGKRKRPAKEVGVGESDLPSNNFWVYCGSVAIIILSRIFQ